MLFFQKQTYFPPTKRFQVRKIPLAKMAKFLLQDTFEQPRLTMTTRVDSACLISEFSHGKQLPSLLIHQNVRLVCAKMAFET